MGGLAVNMQWWLYRVCLGMAVLLAIPLSGASEPSGALPAADSGPSPERVMLQLQYSHQFQFAGFYAAIEKGYYREAGLDVVLRDWAPGVVPIDEVLAGRAAYGVSGSQLISEFAQGKPLMAMAALFQHVPSVYIVLESSGIRTPHDLSGKRVALPADPSASLLLMLMREGVNPDSLDRVLKSTSLEDLLSGGVDAISGYVSNQPYDLHKQGIPFRMISPVDYGIDFYGDTLFTSRHEAEAHPERVEAFRKASLKGWDYAMGHPEEMIDLILRSYAPGSDRNKLAFEAEAIRRLMMPDEIEIGHMNPGRWAAMAHQLHAAGLIGKDVSEQQIMNDFLFDSHRLYAKKRSVRILLWSALIFSAVVLVLSVMILSLKQMVRHRTKELAAANRLLVQENRKRENAQFLLRLQRDLAMVLTTLEKNEEEFGCLLEKVLSIPGIEVGGIYLVDDQKGGLSLRVHRGLSDRFVEQVRYVAADSPRYELVMAGKPVFQPFDHELAAEGLLAVIIVPILLGTRVLGTLNVGSRSLTIFPEEKSVAIEAIAMQIGSIIDRLRAHERLRESEQNYRNLVEVGFDALLIGGQDGVFRYVNKQTADLTGYSVHEMIGMPITKIIAPSQLELVKQRFYDRLKGLPVPSRYEMSFIRKDGVQVPVCVSARRIEWHGEAAVMAVGTDLTERKRLEQAVLKISQWEKRRIGHDLHDSLGQQLTGIAYLCQALEDDLGKEANPKAAVAARLGDLLRTAIEELRRTVRGLAPVKIEEGGLISGLTRLEAEVESTLGVAIHFSNLSTGTIRNPDMAGHLYHVAQEALTNAARHGGARTVLICLSGNEQQGELTIEDDGSGFSPSGDALEGSGMKIMQYRASMIGGTLAIAPNAHKGLTVRCTYDITMTDYRGEGQAE